MTILKTTALWLTALASIGANAGCVDDPAQVCSSSENKITVEQTRIGRDPSRVKNLFGLHSLWWGVQATLANDDGVVTPEVADTLKVSGVSAIRNGGGANESNWRECIGPQASRKAQKVVDWAGPMVCRFGVAEYERLNDALGVRVSWHIANMVGYEMQVNSPEAQSVSAAHHARTVANLAPRRTRYWEMGNELERGRLKWPAAEIAARTEKVARAIGTADPEAKLVLPLTEYRPAWMRDDKEHNRELIRRFKPYSNSFALHLYYDNPPDGPSVANRLQLITSTIRLIQGEGVTEPAIWITEHARWPKGNSSMSNWKTNWYQTEDFDAVLSTADFLAGLSQIEPVVGAMWHGLRTGPWNFLREHNGRVEMGPIAELYRFLRPSQDLTALETRLTSRPTQDHLGRYAIRASAFTQDHAPGVPRSTIVWIVNRSAQEQPVWLELKALHARGSLDVTRRTLLEDPDSKQARVPKLVTLRAHFTAPMQGNRLAFAVPPRSVNVLEVLLPPPLPGSSG